MSNVGNIIRNKRESLNYSIDDISSKTAIRKHIIVAMEEGRFYDLPSFVHAYGFLEQYCKVLGLDFKNDIKPMFDDECKREGFNLPESVTSDDSKSSSPKIPNNLKIIFTLGAVLLLIAAVAVINLGKRDKALLTTDNNTSIVNNVEVKEVHDVITPDATADRPAETTASVRQDIDTGPEVLVIHKATLVFSEECWTMLKIDNGQPVDFMAKAGEVKTVTFVDSFTVDVGNSVALTVKYNDQTYKNFGLQGVYTKNHHFSIDDNNSLKYTKLQR